MDLLVAGLVLLVALYVAITLALTVGLGRNASRAPDGAILPVTLIVCARNEQDRIGACLEALARQAYPADRTQVIVVDDRSTDRTAEIARQFADRFHDLRVIPVTHRKLRCPKKNALTHGLAEASGDIILTTDADCEPSPGWIASTVAAFDERVGVVVGPSPLSDPGARFASLLVFQSLVVNALAAGSAGIGIPLTCSGRNLAYRRAACEQAGGYEPIGDVIGGDDVLLMRRIHRIGWRVVYNQDPDARVVSPAHTDRQWSRQIRYQSKARHYGPRVLFVAGLIYILHLLLFTSPAWAWHAPETLPILWSVLFAKATADGVFLWRAARRLGYAGAMRWFPVVELLIVPYVAVVCAVGTLRPGSWT